MIRKSSFALLIILFLALVPRLPAQEPSKTPPTAPATQPSAPAKTETVEHRVEQYLRKYYAWGPEFDVKADPAKPSPIPDLLEVSVTVTMAGQSDVATVYVSKDGKFILRGDLSEMSVDPFAETRKEVMAGTGASMGPEDAKVTLVEFADFECPSCRALDLILRDVLQKHPEIHLVYKYFPLTEIHPWAMTAAIAGQCSNHQSSASFWTMHHAIYDAQDLFTASNAFDKLTDLAQQQGLNMDAFRSCMADPKTTQEVETNISEGHALDINETPTIFVNGRRITGADEVLLDQFIQFESSH